MKGTPASSRSLAMGKSYAVKEAMRSRPFIARMCSAVIWVETTPHDCPDSDQPQAERCRFPVLRCFQCNPKPSTAQTARTVPPPRLYGTPPTSTESSEQPGCPAQRPLLHFGGEGQGEEAFMASGQSSRERTSCPVYFLAPDVRDSSGAISSVSLSVRRMTVSPQALPITASVSCL